MLERLTVDRLDRVVTVRVKVHLMPEATITIPLGPRFRPKKRHQKGALSLTPREMAFLHWLDQGKSSHEAAELMKVAHATTRQWTRSIRRKMGIDVLSDAVAQARSRIKYHLPTLPLHYLASPQFEGDSVRPTDKLMELLPFFANGASIKEVAQETGLPVSTISGRRQRLFQLLGANTNYEMVKNARKMKLI
jgi:DNA-binding NarL/FixJ family response regulator